MSTKATIAYGKTFHFYHECLDDDHVYLELEGTEFEAGYNRVMVPIPIHIWEVIRKLGAADLSLAPLSDSELLKLANEQVDDEIKQYVSAKENSILRTIYRRAENPRDVQIAERRKLSTVLRQIGTIIFCDCGCRYRQLAVG